MTRPLSTVLFLLILPILLGAPRTFAQPAGGGVGVSLGVTNGAQPFDRHPVGIAGKLWTSNQQALAGGTSLYLGEADRSYWLIQSDYLFHNFNAVAVEEGLMALYVGGGAQYTVLEAARNQFSLRIPTGVTYLPENAPIDFFVEITPTLSVTVPASLRFDGAFGFRYYFSMGEATSE